MIARDTLKKTLVLIGRHAELLTDFYFSRHEVIDDEGDKVIQKLRRSELLWYAPGDDGLRMVPELSGLCTRVVRDPTRRVVDPNVGGGFSDLCELVDGYKAALGISNAEAVRKYRGEIQELVARMTSDLREATDLLSVKAHSKFGYISSLDLKYKENEIVLSQAKKINSQLGILPRDELETLAGFHLDLRRILIDGLWKTADECRRELDGAIHIIRHMLFQFRDKRRIARLASAFSQRYHSDPDYHPADYCAADIPAVFNQITPMPIRGHADLTSDEDVLTELIAGLRKTPAAKREVVDVEPVLVQDAPPPEKIELPPIHRAIDDFIYRAHTSNTWLSALANAPEAEVADAPLWLWMLMTRLAALNEIEPFVEVHYDARIDPIFNGNRHLSDVHIARLGTTPPSAAVSELP